MELLNIAQLNSCNYNLNVINALRQCWNSRTEFSCIGTPKQTNMLLYLDGLSARYTLKDGSVLFANPGDIVYLPAGSEYHSVFSDKKDDTANTVGINFFIYNEENTSCILSESVTIFRSAGFGPIINKINRAGEMAVPCYGEMKAGMYELLTLLCRLNRGKNLKKFSVISQGIRYLEEYPLENLSISEIAALCHVSEIYFRKLFKEYSGLSPLEYRIKQRIEKAKNYLEYDDISITEIAELLNFTDTSYFCKQFKLHTGVSPLKYKTRRT